MGLNTQAMGTPATCTCATISYGHPKNVEILTMSQKIKLALGASSRKNLTTGAPLNGL
jgi:hypothetical protein